MHTVREMCLLECTNASPSLSFSDVRCGDIWTESLNGRFCSHARKEKSERSEVQEREDRLKGPYSEDYNYDHSSTHSIPLRTVLILSHSGQYSFYPTQDSTHSIPLRTVLILSHSGQYSFYPTQDHSHPLLSHTLLPQHTATVTTATVTTATVTPHLNDSSNRGRVVIQGASAVSGLHGNTSGSTEAL